MARIGRDGLLNLDDRELRHAMRLGLDAAHLALRHASEVHYSQGPDRWEYIDKHLRAYRGEYPHHADCSSFATGVLWDATRSFKAAHGRKGDFVNHAAWEFGHTGTLVQHGREVSFSHLRPLDLVFYGNEGWRPGHVAIYVGRGRVISHGSEGGPYLLPVRYRLDAGAGGFGPRRYLH